ncbi:unnamed protein product [Hyaloperonospora brassicae]|uniref:W2 domain-containing protein n=1 Tax=Hyaloperonospora brassicae TaxID=162125 RepID=A0AAV0ULW8_HYABA|nr:unnamed protein product [Hyaloperonospora brassicae]
MVRAKKIGLGEFLGDKAAAYIPEASLPSGPRARADDDTGNFRGGGRGGDRYSSDRYGDRNDQSRSDQSDQWRGDRSSSRMDESSSGNGGSNWRGGGGGAAASSRFERPSRDAFQAEERPAHMRLNLARRGEASGDVRATSSGSGRLSSFREAGDMASAGGGRFTGGGRAAGRFAARGSDDVTTSLGAVRLGSRHDEPVARKTAATPEPEPLSEKKLRAQQKREERKKKAEEERLAAEEAKRQAAEAKKQQDEELAQQAEKDRETMRQVLASGKKGEELAAVAQEAFAANGRPSGAMLFEMVTAAAEDVAKSSANWIAMPAYGELLKLGMDGSDKKDQMQALYALQIFLNKYDFPTGVLEKCFMALYSLDIIDEAGFLEHKYDVDGDVPGRMKAIVQTSAWLTWLETPEEESEEEADE